MEPRRVLSAVVRLHVFGGDGVEVERRRVDDPRAGRAPGQDLRRHDGAGIKADRAALDERTAANGDEVGGAGACSDEMDSHELASERARAQVAEPDAMRSRMSCACGPTAASAAASATDPTPCAAMERVDCVRT